MVCSAGQVGSPFAAAHPCCSQTNWGHGGHGCCRWSRQDGAGADHSKEQMPRPFQNTPVRGQRNEQCSLLFLQEAKPQVNNFINLWLQNYVTSSSHSQAVAGLRSQIPFFKFYTSNVMATDYFFERMMTALTRRWLFVKLLLTWFIFRITMGEFPTNNCPLKFDTQWNWYSASVFTTHFLKSKHLEKSERKTFNSCKTLFIPLFKLEKQNVCDNYSCHLTLGSAWLWSEIFKDGISSLIKRPFNSSGWWYPRRCANTKSQVRTLP